MLKKTIKYTDWNGLEREEDFYFNLTKSEIARMQFDADGTLADRIRNIIRAKDTKEIMKIFEGIILKAYGKKSDDGRRFIKKDANGNDLAIEFTESPAFDELYFELISDSEKFAAFVNALIPSDLADEVKRLQESGEIKDLM